MNFLALFFRCKEHIHTQTHTITQTEYSIGPILSVIWSPSICTNSSIILHTFPASYSFFLESPLPPSPPDWVLVFTKLDTALMMEEKYFLMIPWCFKPGSSTRNNTIRYVRNKLLMLLPIHAEKRRLPVTTTKYVLGFDSFMEERVWETEEARQHREAMEVMICS